MRQPDVMEMTPAAVSRTAASRKPPFTRTPPSWRAIHSATHSAATTRYRIPG
jgi:hypothetical protein